MQMSISFLDRMLSQKWWRGEGVRRARGSSYTEHTAPPAYSSLPPSLELGGLYTNFVSIICGFGFSSLPD
jgi:hypothetical protein